MTNPAQTVPPAHGTPIYLNSLRVSDLVCVMMGLDNNNPAAYVHAEPGDVGLGSYAQASLSDLEEARAAFIAAVGYPWLAIGDLSDFVWSNGHHATIAINLNQTAMAYSDTGTGIQFGNAQFPTLGYAPWSSYADAAAGIEAMIRDVTWSPSS
jgi:hypothetical protein